MAEEEDKLTALFGFATGIELSQLVIILSVLVFCLCFSISINHKTR